MASVLVVDDKEGIRSFIAEVLVDDGYDVETARDGKEALAFIEKRSFHLMISDLRMPNMDGMALLEKARKIAPEMPVIMLTAHGTVDTAVAAMKMGALDYLTKPLSGPDELLLVTSRAVAHRKAIITKVSGNNVPPMVAADPVMQSVVELIGKVAVTDATVLLLGESGTGKEVAARQIHHQSNRREGPFVPINCAAISEKLVESEMFGHEKGAFTGATDYRIGRFEQADGGTLFLDEVGELPLGLQAKLLRVLQEQTFERVGGNRAIHVDVRVVAATNRDLSAEIASGRFREDLFHRLSVFPIQLPPLRERPSDIRPLAAHLLQSIRRRFNRPSLSLSESAFEALSRYPWPGNVRELGNVLERSAIISGADMIGAEHLGLSGNPLGNIRAPDDTPSGKMSGSLRAVEREAIRQALLATDGHRKKAAERLGIGLRTLYNKIKEYGLE